VFLIYGGTGILLLPLVLTLAEEPRPRIVHGAESAWKVIGELVGDPRLLLMWLGGAMAIASGLGFAAWAPSYFVRDRGLGVTEAGAIFGGGALIGGVLGSILGGYLADWRRRVRLAGEFDVSVAAAVLTAPLIVLTISSTSPWIFAPSGIAACIAIYSVFPSLNAMLVTLVPKERHGLATAVNVFFMGGVGSAAGPFVIGVTSDLTGSLHTAMFTPAVGVLIAAALVAAAGWFVRARG
jgi:predicted MFS family arabinose efflux permease